MIVAESNLIFVKSIPSSNREIIILMMMPKFSLVLVLFFSFFTVSSVIADESKKVVMFSSTFCPACAQAKDFFKAHEIDYLEFDIEKSTAARSYFERLGGRGTPFLLINNRRMQGFSETKFWNYYGIRK